jgi:hypothetical protein
MLPNNSGFNRTVAIVAPAGGTLEARSQFADGSVLTEPLT